MQRFESDSRGKPGVDPDALVMAEIATKAIEEAIVACGVIICTMDGDRKLRKGDARVLEQAGMAGWEVSIYKMVGDESLTNEIRGKAIKSYMEQRQKIYLLVRQMVRAIVGG